MTEQDITTAVDQAKADGRIKTVSHYIKLAIVDIKVNGMKWRDAAEKHHVSMGGISRCMAKIFV